MPIIVIFGGSGFIGSHLIKQLATSGNYKVVSVDRREPQVREPDVEYILQDVRDLKDLSIEGKIDRIYNLAAVHTTPGHPTHEYYDTNISGASEITAFARRNGVTEIIFTSSISVYGPGEDEKRETTAPAPVSAYGWSKLLAERIHQAWLREDERHRLVIVRPAVVFGPRENGNFTRLARMLKKGVFVYPGRRDTIKACIYVEDLLRAIEFARAETAAMKIFNGAYPNKYTIEDIVQAFRAEHFRNVKTFVFPKQLMMMVAGVARPFAASGLGIHPERILKLVRSTDIAPGWLQAKEYTGFEDLNAALRHWSEATSGSFE